MLSSGSAVVASRAMRYTCWGVTELTVEGPWQTMGAAVAVATCSSASIGAVRAGHGIDFGDLLDGIVLAMRRLSEMNRHSFPLLR